MHEKSDAFVQGLAKIIPIAYTSAIVKIKIVTLKIGN